MSAQFPPPEQERSPKEAPQLSEEYTNAFNWCVRNSVLLWTTMGFTLNMKGKWGIGPEGLRAVPAPFVILTLLSVCRMVIGWSQCGAEKSKLATLDYILALLFASGGILIWVVQYFTQTQIVDFWIERFYSPEQRATLEQVLFIGIALFVCTSITGIREWKDFGWLRRTITVLSIPMNVYFGLVLLKVVAGQREYVMAAAALIMGVFLALFPQFLLSRIQPQRKADDLLFIDRNRRAVR